MKKKPTSQNNFQKGEARGVRKKFPLEKAKEKKNQF